VRVLAVLLALAAPVVAAGGPKPAPLDEDFEAEAPVPSLAVGPVRRGGLVTGLAVGWLRSEAVAQVGLGYWLDLSFRAESMTLYQGFDAQNAVYAGARVSPLSEGTVRLSVLAEAGMVFAPISGATKSFSVLRGELAAGLAFQPVTVYARLALRGAGGDSLFVERRAFDTEAGLGVEGHLSRKLVVGAEAYWWAREQSDTLWQWRIRVGWAI
jgi:hypothetical protein